MAKPKKKRDNQGTTFFIPNTSQGRALLAQMRFRLNRKHWSISVMGRGPRKGKGLRHPQSYLNLAHAVTFAVYLKNKRQIEAHADWIARICEENRKMWAKIQKLEAQLALVQTQQE